jgi:hypothetical protein
MQRLSYAFWDLVGKFLLWCGTLSPNDIPGSHGPFLEYGGDGTFSGAVIEFYGFRKLGRNWRFAFRRKANSADLASPRISGRVICQ